MLEDTVGLFKPSVLPVNLSHHVLYDSSDKRYEFSELQFPYL